VNYLLDTNVVSELRKKIPDPHVLAWFEQAEDERLYFSVLSVGEIRRGIERLDAPDRKRALAKWLEEELLPWFGNRLLPVSLPVAECWGKLLAQAGRPLPSIDSLLAATALEHGLTLVTRNVQDFDLPGLKVENPWTWSIQEQPRLSNSTEDNPLEKARTILRDRDKFNSSTTAAQTNGISESDASKYISIATCSEDIQKFLEEQVLPHTRDLENLYNLARLATTDFANAQKVAQRLSNLKTKTSIRSFIRSSLKLHLPATETNPNKT
jgi:predicted nucleic acid-binding protein